MHMPLNPILDSVSSLWLGQFIYYFFSGILSNTHITIFSILFCLGRVSEFYIISSYMYSYFALSFVQLNTVII